jgi:predicted dienelactone hydrolase
MLMDKMFVRRDRRERQSHYPRLSELPKRSLSSVWGKAIVGLGTTALVSTLMIVPSWAAEQVRLQLGFFSRTVPVSSVATFAADGTIDEHLQPFLMPLDDEALASLREALNAPRQEDPTVFSQKLHTPMGTQLLRATGLTVQTGSRLNGQIALRSALSRAMQEPTGATFVNVLRYFPTETVTLDLARMLAVNRQLQQAIAETDAFMTAVTNQAASDAAKNPVDYTTLPDLRDRGPYAVEFMPLDLVDDSRNRAVPADLFLPDIPNAEPGSIPVLVFSHGLGHSRTYFRDVAEHVASYGFAVALPEHVGSNGTQRQDLEAWLEDEFFLQREFIHRPSDVSFLLDELDRMNASSLNQQLNTQAVGAVGHSFGGYTVLVNAGATVDFDWLSAQCQPDTEFLSNISRLLQCRALELQDSPEAVAALSNGSLKDDRIQFVMAFNTVSNLFGESGTAQIQVPTLIAGGIFDFVTPVIPEQADTFSWLTTPEKYFLLVDQKAHDAGSTRALMQFFYAIEDDLELELTQAWLRSNYKALVVTFAQTFVADREEYRPYLEAAYVKYISQSPFNMHMIRGLPESVAPETP